jgi:biotin transport system permease protein
MTPYRYISGTSPLHRCPAALKLLGLLLVSTGAFFSFPGLAAAGLMITAGSLAAGIRPWKLLRGSRPVLFLAVFMILFRTIRFDAPDPAGGLTGKNTLNLPFLNTEGFFGGLHQGLCLIISFAAGALLFSVTTTQELRDSLGRVESAAAHWFSAWPRFFRTGAPLKRRAHSGFSLGLSLMLGFLPRFFELWETANLACDARAGKKGRRRFLVLMPLVIERMMEMAGETAEALESRGLSLFTNSPEPTDSLSTG